jgi:hypothetical protein
VIYTRTPARFPAAPPSRLQSSVVRQWLIEKSSQDADMDSNHARATGQPLERMGRGVGRGVDEEVCHQVRKRISGRGELQNMWAST